MAMAKNVHAVALGRLGGAKGGPARARALSSKRRTEIARSAGLARAKGLSPAQRSRLARVAARARWAAARQFETAQDAPEAVRRLLKTYDPAQLKWSIPIDRYAVVREILVRGDGAARRWLRRVLPRKQVRNLLRAFAGAGCSEPERARLRKAFRLTVRDIPKRPHKPALWTEQ
jgi:hypothetical protein